MKTYLHFLSRNKLYTAIEAFGLIVSLAFLIVIGSSIRAQIVISSRVPDHERIYVIGPTIRPDAGQYRMRDALSQLPQLESIAAFTMSPTSVEVNGEKYSTTVCVADPELLDMISLAVKSGNPEPLFGVNDVAITADAARRIFPDRNPVGEMVGFAEYGSQAPVSLQITSIIENPSHSILSDFDFIVNIQSDQCPLASEIRGSDLERRGQGMMVFFIGKVYPETDLAALSQQIEDLPGWLSRNLDTQQPLRNLTPFDSIYYSPVSMWVFRQGKKLYLTVLVLLCFVLLLSSMLSYVNLSMAASGDRAREMATRRLVGDDRVGIFRRVLGESILFTLVCFLLAIPLAFWLAPLLDSLRPVGLNIPFSIQADGTFWLLQLGLALLLGLLAGIAPSWMSASVRPIDVVSGKIRRKRKMYFNCISVIVQSAITLVLIVMALVMERQLDYMEKADIGVDPKENVFYCGIPLSEDKAQILADRLRASPQVLEIGFTLGYPTYVNFRTVGKEMTLAPILCDSTAFSLLGFRIVNQFAQTLNATFVSQKVANACGVSREKANLADVYGYYERMRDHLPPIIGGIVEDFRINPVNGTGMEWDMENDVGAIVQVCDPAEMYRMANLLIRTTPDRKAFEKWLKPEIRDIFRETFGYHDIFTIKELRVGYLDDLMAADHDDLRRYTRLVEIFCLVSILLSLLALLAMSSYYAGVNAKGIAVRKVFGGTINSETRRGVLIYMGWVGISILIAIPVSVWLADRFLQRYPEHLTNYGWIFVVAVLITVLLSFLSVLWQTLKAARTNPAVELKKE